VRPNTPPERIETGGQRITVKRSCERCGRDVGDATADELDAAIEGRPLPNVVDECRCLTASIAVLTVADHADDTVLPLELGGGLVEYRCACGEKYVATPEVTREDALNAHQVEEVRTALRESEA
jgi:hypothetical protein